MMSRVYKIGKSELNDVVMNHPSISLFHAEVFVDPQGNCFYTDLNSPSRTTLNGKKLIEPAILRANDHLELGDGQHFDWEYIFFNRKKPEPEKKIIERPEPPKSTVSKQLLQESPSQSFVKNNLDLILIFGGIILMLFLLGVVA